MIKTAALSTSAPVTSARAASPGRWLLATLCLANFMAALDLFVVNVALQGIGTHFGGSLANVSWVLNAYAIVFGALLIPAGRVADRFGRKGIFMLGVVPSSRIRSCPPNVRGNARAERRGACAASAVTRGPAR